MMYGESFDQHILRRLDARLRPLGIELDRHMRVVRWSGNPQHYGFDALPAGSDMTALLPMLQGLQSDLTTEFAFVEMSNGCCANIQLSLSAEGSLLILTDDTDQKLRYQSLRQTSNQTILDAYRRAQAEEALFREKELAEVTLKSIGDAVIRCDQNGRISYLNPIAEAMVGYGNEEARGQPIEQIFRVLDAETHQPTINPMRLALNEDRMVGLAMNAVLVGRSGKHVAIEDSAGPIHDRDGKVIGAVLVFRDVSEARAMTVRMTHLAQHDHLTALPNRVMLHDRIVQAIMAATRHHKRVALLFLDLDRFKYVNDSLGHIVGDKLLQELARRLKACVRSTDTVSRLGGDEFVVLLSEANHPNDVVNVANKLLSAVAQPFEIEGNELDVTLSIGISIFPEDGSDVDTLMKCADAAMYHAKENGRNNYQFFTRSIHEKAIQRQRVESGLRRALKHSEFQLYYQPKLCLSTASIVGFEALLRWQDPIAGLIEPSAFIRIAEECGLIGAIGDWVLRQACSDNHRFQREGLLSAPVAVNISAVQFRDKDFSQGIAQVLQRSGLAPQFLELELTESIIMHDGPQTLAALEALRAMGIKLSIDDFGTGYSSLAYLRRFAIDALKIDRSFVHDITTDTDDQAIVSAIINMARGLKRRVIAEGVESVGQLRFLRAHQCDEVQGYYFCRPLPAPEFERFVRSGAWRATLA